MNAPVSPPRWWQWPTVLSLDAPVVVIVWQWLFAALTGGAVKGAETFVVGASVWMAYAADRWFEARRLPAQAILTTRHRFYHDHRTAVAVVWLVVLMADLAVAFGRLSHRELVAGAILLVPALAYVLSHQLLHRDHPWRVPKELCVAVLIAGGAGVFVVADATHPTGPLWSAIALFAALCFVNVMLISAWEQEVDATQGQDSLVRQFGHGATISRVLPLALAAFAAFAATPLFSLSPVVAHCVAASGLLLALIDRYETKLGWQPARVLADVALLTPLLPLLRGLAG